MSQTVSPKRNAQTEQLPRTAKSSGLSVRKVEPVFPTIDEAIETLRILVAELSADGRPIRVLEAGCGSGTRADWLFRLKANAHIVGIDVSREALDNNHVVSEKILADIQTHALPEKDFDLIICYDVLEHLPSPELALGNFATAVNDGGLIVLASPLVHSLKGMITKLSPHWFHVLACRYLIGYRDAGRPGCLPFPTFLRWSMAPGSVLRLAKDRGLKVEYFCIYGGMMGWEDAIIKKSKWLGRSFLVSLRIFGKLVELLSFGKISSKFTEYMIVLRRGRVNG